MKPTTARPELAAVLGTTSLEELFEVLTDGVCVLDADGRVVSWNRAAAEITGFEVEEAIGRTPDFLEGIGCPGFGKLVAALRGPPPGDAELRDMECAVRGKAGRPVRLFGHARILRDRRGAVRGAIACFMDLTPIDTVAQRVAVLAEDLDVERGFGRLVGRSPAMRMLFRQIQRAAASDATVLLSGESGTGKELVARTIHDQSPRSAGPFVAVHCSALPESLLESELFGHARGAFTGAVAEQKGRFELADGGTLFLDEIGELTPWIQVKLLRVLETRTIERVGEGRARSIDVRIVAASHRDLAALVADGRMREDFYYRIHVFPMRIPPLRERREDVPALATALLASLPARAGGRAKGFTREALAALTAAPWRGNVRELRNAIEYACVVADGERIDVDDLPPDVLGAADPTFAGSDVSQPSPAPARPIPGPSDAAIAAALAAAGGRVGLAAKRLGISRVTLWRRRRALENASS